MRSRLYQSIQNAQPLEIIQEIKPGSEASYDLSAAVYAGRLDIVSWLINEGVMLPLLGSDIERQHLLMAYFLAACGVHHLREHTSVTEGACFRALTQKEDGLFNALSANLSNPHQFIELALERKNLPAAKILLSKSKERNLRIRNEDVFNCTAEYWTSVHGLEFSPNENQDEKPYYYKTEDWYQSLQQLRRNKECRAFEATYHKALKQDPKVAEFFDLKKLTADEKISDNLLDALQAAACANAQELEKYHLSLQNSYDLFIFAYQRKNYVAVNTIVKNSNPLDLLKMLIEKGQIEISLFLLVGTALNLGELELTWKNEKFFQDFRPHIFGDSHDAFCQMYAGFTDFKQWKEHHISKHINQQVSLLSQFETQLKKEIDSKSCMRERFGSPAYLAPFCKIPFRIYLFLMLGGLATLITGLLKVCPDEIETEQYTHQSYDQGNNCILGGGLGMFTISLVYWLAVLGSQGCIPTGIPLFKKGRERFHSFTINRFSQALSNSANAIFNEFKEMRSNPFAHSNLNSSVASMLPDIQRLQKEKQDQLAKIEPAAKALPALLEVKVEVASATEDAIPDLLMEDEKTRLIFNRG